MRSSQVHHVGDQHAEGMLPRAFTGSVGEPRGTAMVGRSRRFMDHHGELPLHTDFVNKSRIGSRFVGRLVEETEVAGIPAVIPTTTGRAWITGTAQYLLDPSDPFPRGFLL